MEHPPRPTPESKKLPTQSLEGMYSGQESGTQISTENTLLTFEGNDVAVDATYEVKIAGARPTFSLQKLLLRNPKEGSVVDVKEIIGAEIPVTVDFNHDPRARGGTIIANPFDGMPGLLTLLHEAGHVKQKDEPAFRRASHGANQHKYLHSSLLYLDGKVELPRELQELKSALDGINESDSEEAWKKYVATVVKGPFKDLFVV